MLYLTIIDFIKQKFRYTISKKERKDSTDFYFVTRSRARKFGEICERL